MQTWARISCILLKQQYPQETLYLLRVFAAGNFKIQPVLYIQGYTGLQRSHL